MSPFEQGEIRPDLFRKACEFGLEGQVSKHRDRPYQAGRSKHWIKVKNRKHSRPSQAPATSCGCGAGLRHTVGSARRGTIARKNPFDRSFAP